MKNVLFGFAVLMSLNITAQQPASPGVGGAGIVGSEFIFNVKPTPECHASTIVQTTNGLLAAWFGGSREKALDVGIWLSRFDGQRWSQPEEVANGGHEDICHRYSLLDPGLF